MHLDNLAVNGGGKGSEFPKVDFNCLKEQYPVTLKSIDIVERANEHLKIGISVLQHAIGYEEGELKVKKRVFIFSKGSVH